MSLNVSPHEAGKGDIESGGKTQLRRGQQTNGARHRHARDAHVALPCTRMRGALDPNRGGKGARGSSMPVGIPPDRML